jgi:transposase
MQTVPDRLWDILEPLLPEELPRPRGGRSRIENRAVVAGILFVLRTGCPWSYVPQEMGCGCGTTCWRRLRDWQAAGVWARLERELLQRLSDLPLATLLTAANVNDSVMFEEVLNAIPLLHRPFGERGHPAADRARCMRTKATISRTAVASGTRMAWAARLRALASNRKRTWDAIVESSSARGRGSIAFADYVSATNATPTCTRR